MIPPPHDTPLVSIVVPVYNSESFVSICLDSLLNQTMSRIEVLCVDDGSTDCSLAVLNDYAQKDSRVKVLPQAHAGLATARNTGLANIQAPFLMFCDSDDWYEPDMCEEMLSAIREHNVDLVICDTDIVARDTTAYEIGRDSEYPRLKIFGKCMLTDQTKPLINVMAWNKIFRIDLIRQYDMRFPDGYVHEDNSFSHQYLSVSETCYCLNKKLYNYLLRPDSIMGKVHTGENPMKYDIIHCMAFTLDFLLRHDLIERNQFFIEHLNGGFRYYFDFMNKTEQVQAAKLISEHISAKLDDWRIESLPFLNLCKLKHYREAIRFCYSTGNLQYKVLGLTLLKKQVNPYKTKYYFLGIEVLKTKVSGVKKVVYFFGIKAGSFRPHS